MALNIARVRLSVRPLLICTIPRRLKDGEINSEVLMAVGGLRCWEVILPPGDPTLAAPQKPAITPIR